MAGSQSNCGNKQMTGTQVMGRVRASCITYDTGLFCYVHFLLSLFCFQLTLVFIIIGFAYVTTI